MDQLNRRQLLKAGTLLAGATFAASALGQVAHAAQSPASKPNILYIVADDLGWKDVGFNGSDISTPNIDKLASSGAKLNQFYVQPMCTPTRACLLSGRYPLRYGLQTIVIPSSHTYGLPTDEFLLPQALKEAGYSTAIIGKWHLGHGDKKYWPRQRGFDYQYGPLIGEIDYYTHKQHGITDWFRDNEVVEEEGYSTTLFGNDAVKYIGAHSTAKPMYLYLAFNSPHTPYQVPQEYSDRYKSIQDPSRRAYAGMITCMDEQIGRVLKALDEKGMRDNTLIVFHSDNGGTRNAMFAGEIDSSKIVIPCDNTPYRGGKGSLYEGGTRVAGIVNWPGKIKAGSSVDGMIHVADMLPTLTALAGGSTAKCKPLDGSNVWATLSQNAPSPRTEVVYNIEPFRAGVRQGDWKLIWKSILPEKVELFNIAKDPYEKENVADKYPDIVTKLKARANQLASQQVAPMVLQTEFNAMRQRLVLPPALPGEEMMFTEEH
jgi:arylsulfatase A-like enzyme